MLLCENWPFCYNLSGLWAGTVKTVPTKLMTKIVGTDLSVPGLTQPISPLRNFVMTSGDACPTFTKNPKSVKSVVSRFLIGLRLCLAKLLQDIKKIFRPSEIQGYHGKRTKTYHLGLHDRKERGSVPSNLPEQYQKCR